MTVTDEVRARAAELTAGWSDEAKAELAAKLQARARRLQILRECPTPIDLACRFDRTYVRTPALELVSQRLGETIQAYDGRLVISTPPQVGKALDCATPMLTVDGWSTMGELRVGDEVFHPDGHPARVVGVSDVMLGHRCYRVTMTDGRSIVADAEHLWTVRDRSRRGGGAGGNAPAPWEVLTTERLIGRGILSENGKRANGTPHRAYRFSLPRQHEIVSKPVELPVDPYVLGAWLGDGTSSGAGFTSADTEIIDQIRAAGYTVTRRETTKYGWYINRSEARVAAKAEALRLAKNGMSMREAYRGVGLPLRSNLVVPDRVRGQQSEIQSDPSKWVPRIRSFQEELRALGVLDNKHVPDVYLAAGGEQRLALLQGLLDTDGSIYKTTTSTHVEFSSCTRALSEAVLYLVRSLGWRATMNENAATLNGREVGRRWRVTFTPQQGDLIPFRLSRKAARVQAPNSRGGELHAVSIKSIEEVESRPVRCIKVDREDGLFLAGRDLIATHNTNLVRWAILRALVENPDRRIILASYAVGLARTSGRIVRGHVEAHGDALGISVSRSHADAADWELEGHTGGLLATGRGASMTGRPADVVILDDTLKDQKEAKSAVILANLHEWYDSVVRTRFAPGTPVIVIGTRWTAQDLSGRFIADGWPLVNIPALADGKTPDALARPAGTWLVSARGTTSADWAKTREESGEYTWNALYQGNPVPPEGGVFQREWFDMWRTDSLPAGCDPPIVVIDPADNPGDGDEAGIMVGAKHRGTQRGYLIEDLSAPMTVGRWARVALLACARYHAPTLAFESSLSQLPARVRGVWRTLHQQAVALDITGGDVDAAVARLSRPDDTDEARDRLDIELREIVDQVSEVLGLGQAGPRLRTISARGSKIARMQLVSSAFETGEMRLVGSHPMFEYQAAVWEENMQSPDRVDAAVYLAALLTGRSGVASLGKTTGERVPTSSTGGSRGGRQRSSSRLTRSTKR